MDGMGPPLFFAKGPQKNGLLMQQALDLLYEWSSKKMHNRLNRSSSVLSRISLHLCLAKKVNPKKVFVNPKRMRPEFFVPHYLSLSIKYKLDLHIGTLYISEFEPK